MLLCSSRHIPKNFKRKMAVKLWLRLFPVRSYYFWRISPLITPLELITRRFMTIEIIRSPRGAIYLVIGGGNNGFPNSVLQCRANHICQHLFRNIYKETYRSRFPSRIMHSKQCLPDFRSQETVH